MNPVQVVQEFTDASNTRDMDRLSADAVVQNDAGHVFAQEVEAIRAHFGGFLSQSPYFHSDILSRIHVGS
jgi:hypothetical protein